MDLRTKHSEIMDFKSLVNQLSDRINQPHVIANYLKKVFYTAYDAGKSDALSLIQGEAAGEAKRFLSSKEVVDICKECFVAAKREGHVQWPSFYNGFLAGVFSRLPSHQPEHDQQLIIDHLYGYFFREEKYSNIRAEEMAKKAYNAVCRPFSFIIATKLAAKDQRIAELEAEVERIDGWRKAYLNKIDLLEADMKEAQAYCQNQEQEIAALRTELESLRSKQEWVSVEDRLPDDCGDYLVVDCEHESILLASYYSGDWWIANQGATLTTITRWHPLPTPPQTPPNGN